MRSLAFTGVALAALSVSQPVRAQTNSTVGAPPPPVAGSTGTADQRSAILPPISGTTGTADQRSIIMPPTMGSSGTADQRAATMEVEMTPRRAVRRLQHLRPAYGFQLPQEWMSDEYAIDHRRYGLDRPARGFGWSRYYDDFVLTDQWGRVYDVADGSGRRDADRARDTSGLAGGIAGAAVGAVVGNVIAGTGSRLGGSLIGGGVGAIAGAAAERSMARNRPRAAGDDDRAYDRERIIGHWSGGYGEKYAHDAAGHQACGCSGGHTVTTTTVTYHDGSGSHTVPREVVTYENVETPAPTKIRTRPVAPATDGKTRVRTRVYTKTY